MFLRRAIAVVALALGSLLASSAPASAMTMNCHPTAVARMWVTMCVVIHDNGVIERFVVLP